MKCVGIQYLEAIGRLFSKGHKFLRTLHVLFVPGILLIHLIEDRGRNWGRRRNVNGHRNQRIC